MTNTLQQLSCHQCAAPLPVQQGRQFVTCEFCGAENFVDKRSAVMHYAVLDTIGSPEAQAALRRWMGGNSTVKDLDQKAEITQTSFEMFPMWLVRTQTKGQEQVLLEPAAALDVTELTELSIPAAALEPYDHTLDDQAIAVTVPVDTMKKWLLENQKIPASNITEISLVHLPIFRCKYSFEGRSFTAIVDASSSEVFANVYPSKWEAPYFAIGFLAFIIYFCAAFIPIVGYSAGDIGLGLGILIYIVVAIVVAIPIFGVAAFISAKI